MFASSPRVCCCTMHSPLVLVPALEGIDAAVVDVHTIKSLDTDLIDQMATTCGALVTAEDHSIIGGLGGAVAEHLSTGPSASPLSVWVGGSIRRIRRPRRIALPDGIGRRVHRRRRDGRSSGRVEAPSVGHGGPWNSSWIQQMSMRSRKSPHGASWMGSQPTRP